MSYKILLIDHDPSGAERIQRPLADAGYDVVVATEAAEALSTFERERPDLAVIEALLPEKTGSELCQELKDTPAGKSMPVVLLLETEEDKQARARALDLHGCDLLIERSIPESELLGLCEQLLCTRAAQVDTPAEAEADQETEEPVETGSAEPEPAEAASTEPEPAEAASTEPGPAEAASTEPEPVDETSPEPAEGDNLLGSEGLADAFSRLDTIIDEQKIPDIEAKDAAEEAGDFSYLAKEIGVRPEADVEAKPVDSTAGADVPGFDKDSGQDIADHLDSLFGAEEPAKPSERDKEVLSWTFDNGYRSPEKERDEAKSEQPEAATIAAEAAAPEPAVSGAIESTLRWEEEEGTSTVGAAQQAGAAAVAVPEEKVEPEVSEPSATAGSTPEAAAAVETAAAASHVQTATFAKPVTKTRTEAPVQATGTGKWWLLAACFTVLIVGGGMIWMFGGGSSSTGSPDVAANAGGGVPTTQPPLVAAGGGGGGGGEQPEEPALQSDPLTAGMGSPLAAASGDAGSPAAAAPDGPAPKPVVSEPEPVKVASARKPAESKPAISKPAPQPVFSKPAPKPAPIETTKVAPAVTSAPAAEPEPDEVARALEQWLDSTAPPEPEPAEPQTIAQARPAPTATAPEPDSDPVEAAPSEPVEAVSAPAELLRQVAPNYPPKALRRARGGSIVLKVLVNEKGRIARVLVDKGTPHKEVEAAAISAVLRWVYSPATENGVPVESWTTAEFSF